jgi:hypothetical protein
MMMPAPAEWFPHRIQYSITTAYADQGDHVFATLTILVTGAAMAQDLRETGGRREGGFLTSC